MNKPFVSYCLLTYNQENFIKDAVESALAQDYDGPMEIIISDDGSTDHTFRIASQIAAGYTGKHKIVLNQNKTNLGIREHCNQLLYRLAGGEYIFLAAGDDVSLPERVSRYMNYFTQNPALTSISCKSKEVDINLKQMNRRTEWNGSFSVYTIDDYIRFREFIINSGDSRALKRDVIDRFPPLKYPDAEDISLFYRSLLIGSCGYIREPLVMRRHHSNNSSDRPTADYTPLEKQFKADTRYALKHHYISEFMHEQCNRKIDSVIENFRLYWGSGFRSPKTLFYRALRRLFYVTKG